MALYVSSLGLGYIRELTKNFFVYEKIYYTNDHIITLIEYFENVLVFTKVT